VVSSDRTSKPNEVASLQAPNKRAAMEKRAKSLKYFIILILIQFINSKKEVKKIRRVVWQPNFVPQEALPCKTQECLKINPPLPFLTKVYP